MSVHYAELGTDIEERGLVVNWSTFRFAFCQGGDGESDMTMDVQDLAMFVRHPGSVVTCILLPVSCSMHMHQQVSSDSLRHGVPVASSITYCYRNLCIHSVLDQLDAGSVELQQALLLPFTLHTCS